MSTASERRFPEDAWHSYPRESYPEIVSSHQVPFQFDEVRDLRLVFDFGQGFVALLDDIFRTGAVKINRHLSPKALPRQFQ